MEAKGNDQNTIDNKANPASCPPPQPSLQPLSKNAQKKLLKQQRFEAKKAEKKALFKEQKKREAERKRKEWEEKLSSLSEDERSRLREERKGLRKQRMEKRSEERENKIEKLARAKQDGQNIVIDLEFSHLMSSTELSSLVQQIMYCYAVNGRCASPAHLWLTGCQGEMESQLLRLPGFDKWIIEKENQPYIEAFQDQKEHLVYLTADSETMLDELDPKKMYIVGGLVDRNRWKGITMKKAQEQGIQTAKLPIGNYLKMCSSQVLTVNQVIEILLKFLETRDWEASFQVIPQRKRYDVDSKENQGEMEGEENEGIDDPEIKRQCGFVRRRRSKGSLRPYLRPHSLLPRFSPDLFCSLSLSIFLGGNPQNHKMQSDEGATSMELEKVPSESKRVSFPSKPNFAPLKAHEISDGQVQFRKVSVPPHRYTPLKKVWMEIYTPIYEHMKIDIRMNLKARKVELKTRSDTPDISNLQKCADFVHAFMLGFDVIDAVALLRMDELYVESFEIKDVKTLRGEHLSRAIGRLSGKGGKTKFAIENSTKTRIVIADTKIHILGSFANIKIARDSLCSLILGSPAGKVYSKLRAVTARLAERF
ncbi:unnamed protein product [Ilex paraguariensis]|uniref:SAM-dependent MTase TRM10-type domain-containing protein n=1 Tax=Ilex paraguariensis TaxID=185542 RepID=A0ABC8SHX8_9AQUA